MTSEEMIAAVERRVKGVEILIQYRDTLKSLQSQERMYEQKLEANRAEAAEVRAKLEAELRGDLPPVLAPERATTPAQHHIDDEGDGERWQISMDSHAHERLSATAEGARILQSSESGFEELEWTLLETRENGHETLFATDLTTKERDAIAGYLVAQGVAFQVRDADHKIVREHLTAVVPFGRFVPTGDPAPVEVKIVLKRDDWQRNRINLEDAKGLAFKGRWEAVGAFRVLTAGPCSALKSVQDYIARKGLEAYAEEALSAAATADEPAAEADSELIPGEKVTLRKTRAPKTPAPLDPADPRELRISLAVKDWSGRADKLLYGGGYPLQDRWRARGQRREITLRPGPERDQVLEHIAAAGLKARVEPVGA